MTRKTRRQERRKPSLQRAGNSSTNVQYGDNAAHPNPEINSDEMRERKKRWEWAQEKTKYKASYCEEIIKNAEEGKSYTEFAASIGICRATLYKWSASFPEFKLAMEIAKEKHEKAWWDFGRDELKKNFHFGVWKFVMMNVFGYGRDI